jgi:plasmid stability protein
LTLDDDVAAKLKVESARSGRSFKELVNDHLRFALTARQDERVRKPFKIEAQAMGLRPGLSYDNIEALLDQLEGPARR